jgi:predicted cobalt transporter CbtA
MLEKDQLIRGKKVIDDVEDAIERMGGVSTFQIISFINVVSGMVAGAFILYCLAYFERVPSELQCQYEVDGPWESCEADNACGPDVVAVRGDKDAYDYMKNWATDGIDLICIGNF